MSGIKLRMLHFRGKPDTPVGAQKWGAKLLPVRVRTSKLARNSYTYDHLPRHPNDGSTKVERETIYFHSRPISTSQIGAYTHNSYVTDIRVTR